MKRRWKIVIGVVLVTLGLLPFAFHFQAKWKLASYRAELINQGEKLEFNELVPLTISNGYANAARLMAATTAVGNKLRELSPASMRFVGAGKARVAWREPVIIQEVDPNYVPEIGTKKVKTNVWPLFEAAFAQSENKLKTLRETTSEPLQFPITFVGMNTLLPHLSHLKTSAQYLMAATLGHLRSGKINEATEDLQAQVHLVLNWKHEPTLISQVVRTACASYACAATWEALQTGKQTDTQLQALQNTFECLDLLSDGALAVRADPTANEIIAETRKDIATWTGARNTNRLDEFGEMFGQVLSEPKSGIREMLNRYPKYWGWCWVGSYDDERRALKYSTSIARSLEEAPQAGWKQATKQNQIGDIDAERSAWMFDMTDALRRGAAKFVRQQSEISLVVTAIGLERYRLNHQKYPAALAELTPDICKAVPIDYEDGKPVRYSLRSDGTYLLYSVGDDGLDDHGDATPVEPFKIPGLFNGKDIVWPQPATHEEVLAFEERETKKQNN